MTTDTTEGGSPVSARVTVAANTISVFTDVACGWATVALGRFYRAREALGVDPDRLRVQHRPFLLEEHNEAPLQKPIVEAEIGVLAQLEPEFGWSPWQGAESDWPVSTLLANEAVRAAQRQGLAAAEELDWALRLGLFRDSVCVSMRFEIERIAQGCDLVDADALMADLDNGTVRGELWKDHLDHRELVSGSPHFFTSRGIDVFNPGVEFHCEGEPGAGVPVIDSDSPELVELLASQAAAP